MEKRMTFVQAVKDYFGVKPVPIGQNALVGFIQEIRALDDTDRKYFIGLLVGVGYTIITDL